MSEKTGISWCDSTVNFWSGCTKVSAGCANCYAETQGKRFETFGKWGKDAPRRLHESAFKLGFKLNRKPWVCECGTAFTHSEASAVGMVCAADIHKGTPVKLRRRRILSLSLGDWLDPEVRIEWPGRMLDTVRRCDQVQWLLLTKHPERFLEAFDTMRRLTYAPGGEGREWIDRWYNGEAPANVLVGTSVENQAMADQRIPHLLGIPAAGRFLSMEPLLGPVQFGTPMTGLLGIDWLIIGGESGPKARRCNVEWIRSPVRQGQAAGVPVFVKQLGANPIDTAVSLDYCISRGYAVTDNTSYNRAIREVAKRIKHHKGGDPAEWPEDVRVREFPKVLEG